jgi:hypothetical protein
MCRNCDVQGACLAWALDVGDCHGVWGATTPRERRAMLVAWRGDEEQAEPQAPKRRLETMDRRDGIQTIMAVADLGLDLRARDLALTQDLTQDLALTEMTTVNAIAAAEAIAFGRLTSAETVGAAAS